MFAGFYMFESRARGRPNSVFQLQVVTAFIERSIAIMSAAKSGSFTSIPQ